MASFSTWRPLENRVLETRFINQKFFKKLEVSSAASPHRIRSDQRERKSQIRERETRLERERKSQIRSRLGSGHATQAARLAWLGARAARLAWPGAHAAKLAWPGAHASPRSRGLGLAWPGARTAWGLPRPRWWVWFFLGSFLCLCLFFFFTLLALISFLLVL